MHFVMMSHCPLLAALVVLQEFEGCLEQLDYFFFYFFFTTWTR